ncbi:jg3660 [Pararge aegeria aegeria]|uniref:Jg3660 protein n=1 Tax=Pararge aegeria aegeria TaxID=348720 RepID=A0A8S4QY04_9NEOP|nr:jg3660 [Pararge aegeria aegeria]
MPPLRLVSEVKGDWGTGSAYEVEASEQKMVTSLPTRASGRVPLVVHTSLEKLDEQEVLKDETLIRF